MDGSRTLCLFIFGIVLGFFVPHLSLSVLFLLDKGHRKECIQKFSVALDSRAQKMAPDMHSDDVKSARLEEPIKSSLRKFNDFHNNSQLQKMLQENKIKRTGMIFVGIMTAKKFLDSRAQAVHETWAQTIDGKVLFFAGDNFNHSRLPVVNLPGVDDAYPPQRKSMMMLKYMHDHFIEHYKWFMRVDDDVYVRGDQLKSFLEPLNCSEAHFIGQMGETPPHQLGLEEDENFCMGGPGIIMSGETLKRLVPSIDHCLRNTFTQHEDTELARCIQRSDGSSCIWARESPVLFRHEHENQHFSSKHLNKAMIQHAITLHEIKNSQYMHRLYFYNTQLALQKEMYHTVLYERRLDMLQRLIELDVQRMPADELLDVNDVTNFNRHSETDQVSKWNFSNKTIVQAVYDRSWYSIAEQHNASMMTELLHSGSTQITENYIQKSPLLISPHRLESPYHYSRVHPLYGMKYWMPLSISYRHLTNNTASENIIKEKYWLNMQRPFARPFYKMQKISSKSRDIYIILSIVNSSLPLKQSLDFFCRACLKTEKKCHLIVIFSEGVRAWTRLRSCKIKWIRFKLPYTPFSAMFSEVTQITTDAVLLLTDANVKFTTEFLFRCRQNTIKTKQVYRPIPYKMYNPAITSYKGTQHSRSKYGSEYGFWNANSQHICIVQSDLEEVMKQMIDECQGISNSNSTYNIIDWIVTKTKLDIFQAPDLGFIQLHDNVTCSMESPTSRQSCYSRIAESLGSKRKLYEILSDVCKSCL